MEVNAILRALPLVKKNVIDFRREFYKALILSTIDSLPNKKDGFSEKKIILELQQRIGEIEIKPVIVAEGLELLISEGTIRKSGEKFHLNKDCHSVQFSIDTVFGEFQGFLRTKMREYDPYINKEYKVAFNRVFDRFIAILASSTEISSQIVENAHAEENKRLLAESINRILPNGESTKFVDYFLEYATSNQPKIADTIFEVLQAIIAVDMLNRGTDLSRSAGSFGKGCKLILDTNTIVASLCPTNPRSELTTSTLQFARDLGFEIVYLHQTKKEFYNLLNIANHHMESKDYSFLAKDNEIVTDYLSREGEQSFVERYIELSSFELLIEGLYGAKCEMGIIKAHSKPGERQRLAEAFKIVARAGSRNRSDDAIDHDSDLYLYTKANRHDGGSTLFPNPIIVTLDNTFIALGQLEQANEKSEYGLVMHVRTLLSSLVPFWNPQIRDVDKSALVSGLVKNLTIPIKFGLSIDDYAKILVNKLDLKTSSLELVKKILITSPLKEEIARALQDSDPDRLNSATIRALSDTKAVETIVELQATKQELEDVRDRMTDLSQKYRESQAQLKGMTEASSRPISIEIKQTVPSEVTQSLVAIIALLKENQPRAMAEAGINEGEIKSEDPSTVKNAISKLEAWLNRSGTVIANSQLVLTTLHALSTTLHV